MIMKKKRNLTVRVWLKWWRKPLRFWRKVTMAFSSWLKVDILIMPIMEVMLQSKYNYTHFLNFNLLTQILDPWVKQSLWTFQWKEPPKCYKTKSTTPWSLWLLTMRIPWPLLGIRWGGWDIRGTVCKVLQVFWVTLFLYLYQNVLYKILKWSYLGYTKWDDLTEPCFKILRQRSFSQNPLFSCTHFWPKIIFLDPWLCSGIGKFGPLFGPNNDKSYIEILNFLTYVPLANLLLVFYTLLISILTTFLNILSGLNTIPMRDLMAYTTLSYANGDGYYDHNIVNEDGTEVTRVNLRQNYTKEGIKLFEVSKFK